METVASARNNNIIEAVIHLGIVQNCYHFHERTQRMLGGGGSGEAVLFFFKMSFIVCCYFDTGCYKSTFSKYSFGMVRFLKLRQFHLPRFASVYSAANEYHIVGKVPAMD